MTYRNDLDAARARIETLERERRELVDTHDQLSEDLRAAGQIPPERPRIVPPPAPLPAPKPWPLMTPFRDFFRKLTKAKK